MVEFEDMFKRGTCCVCTKPLKDSKYMNMAAIDKKATWKAPVWTNLLIQGLEDRAIAVVCDGCQEAMEKSGVAGKIKYAIEVREEDKEIIMHDVDELEDVPPLQELVKPTDDPEKKPDIPDWFTGSVEDRKKIDDKLFECCPGSKKDQKHGFFGGLN